MSVLGEEYDRQIQGFEGYNPQASWDYKQHSIGYGTRAQYPGETIDRAEAQRRYDAEIGKAHALVESFAPNAPPGVKAALTSLTYNSGTKWMDNDLGAHVRAGNWSGARDSFTQYVKAGGEELPGLVKRRNAEAQWFGANGQPAAPSGVLRAVTDQGERPMRDDGRAGQTTGSITVNGNTYRFVSGGAGRGASPYGEYSVNGFTSGNQRARQGYQYTRDAYPLSDAKDTVPGDPMRRGLLVHELGSSGVTAGCIGIDGNFHAFKSDMDAELAKNAGLKIVMGPADAGSGSASQMNGFKPQPGPSPEHPDFAHGLAIPPEKSPLHPDVEHGLSPPPASLWKPQGQSGDESLGRSSSGSMGSPGGYSAPSGGPGDITGPLVPKEDKSLGWDDVAGMLGQWGKGTQGGQNAFASIANKPMPKMHTSPFQPIQSNFMGIA